MSRYDAILQHVSRHISLTEAEATYFTSLFRVKTVASKTYLLRQGDDCRYFYYVNEGALRAFHSAANEKESTILFAMPDWWVTDMYCFLNGRPAMMFIEAIADSVLLELGKTEFELLLEKVPKFERYFRILMQNAYTREQLRIIENLSLPALDRYNRFLNKYPVAAAQITQKQLASYLGVSPEFLSSIKSKNRGTT